ncbi:Ferredoxin subunit of nitrite reductase or a ring-hydroxylating dioxygenase [Lutibacter oricola]|uniref:Ferredoxin subunit of nitrite reductase or a ring-hydroxylating dioxygenase n=2 Tax=Lutibacter oricola TaxID=762486 RepID=A0A1H3EET7_9FLAO|nr:Ferredoxin subunit of nitrite reductase or a ring-hydroxylating dioxygenase [Lutibacter oricola]
MRKLIALLLLFSFISCEKNETNDILPDVKVNLTIDLKLPQYNDLQVPSGWSYASGGIKGIIIQNVGVGNPPYKAFERACPNYDCSNPMTFDGSLKLTCPCDGNVYSIIDGSPQTSGDTQYAREYRVNVINSFSLNITNF